MLRDPGPSAGCVVRLRGKINRFAARCGSLDNVGKAVSMRPAYRGYVGRLPGAGISIGQFACLRVRIASADRGAWVREKVLGLRASAVALGRGSARQLGPAD